MQSIRELEQLPENYAELWTKLVRSGYDLYRDHVSTPAFLELLPLVQNLKGLDLGCGEGHNTRLLAERGARMTGVDISPTLIKYAGEEKPELSIDYCVCNAKEICYPNEAFDFVVSFFALLEIDNLDKVLGEIFRVLKKNGFFQFVITHPCFWKPEMNWIEDKTKNKTALACKDYFKDEQIVWEWMFEGVSHDLIDKYGLFKTTMYCRTISEWLNTLIKTGFIIELLHEPKPDKEVIKNYPAISGSEIVPYFLIIRCRK